MTKKDIEIKIPTELSDITLGQHQKLTELYKQGLDDNILTIKIVSLLCGLTEDDVRGLSFDDFTYINTTLTNTLNKQSKFVERFTLNGVEYGFIPNLDEITLGEYVDLDTFIVDYKDMHKIMTILYRPIIGKSFGLYEIEKYTGKEDQEIMKQCPLDAANGAMVFFYRLGNDLLMGMGNYLKREMTNQKHLNPTLVENGDGILQSMQSLKVMLQDLMKQQK